MGYSNRRSLSYFLRLGRMGQTKSRFHSSNTLPFFFVLTIFLCGIVSIHVDDLPMKNKIRIFPLGGYLVLKTSGTTRNLPSPAFNISYLPGFVGLAREASFHYFAIYNVLKVLCGRAQVAFKCR